LVNVRLAVVGELPLLPAEPTIAAGGAFAPRASRRAYLGAWQEVPVYDLEALQPGHDIQGPALFESATTTVLVRRGDRALVTPHGWLDIRLD
jgi:N-methylhydantoinase A